LLFDLFFGLSVDIVVGEQLLIELDYLRRPLELAEGHAHVVESDQGAFFHLLLIQLTDLLVAWREVRENGSPGITELT
jgi:hypothetical protein